MTLADVEKWNPEAIREVFRAAGRGGTAVEDASRTLGSLPFAGWGGDAAAAASNSNDRLRHDLDAHGTVMKVVAAAAEKAADDVALLRRKLSLLHSDADAWGYAVDAATNSVQPTRETKESLGAELQDRIRALLAEADDVDDRLARTIDYADGDIDIPPFHADVQSILDGRSTPPNDPAAFHDWWSQLSREEKDALWEHDQYLGNHGGMPAEDRDHYNRRKLDDELTRSAMAHSEVEILEKAHPDWARGENIPGIKMADRGDYYQFLSHLSDARGRAKDYDDLRATKEQLDPNRADRTGETHPDRLLLVLDTATGDRPHVAIAQGNPDTADNVATYVPGTGSRPSKMGEDMVRVDSMHDAAVAAGGAKTSVIAWFGYDAPQEIYGDAPQREYAEKAAPLLDRFQEGLRGSHIGEPSVNTVIGHSYGTTVVGAAASGGHVLDADQVVFVASPGTMVDHAADLRLTGIAPADMADHVFATKAAHDPVPLYPMAHNGATVRIIEHGASLLPGIGDAFTGFFTYQGLTTDDFGADPTGADFGGTTFSSDPGTATRIAGFDTYNPAAHSEYWTEHNAALQNMGSIIAGHGKVN
ncbi:alpha/beta hydrolase [Smaragdicoccus niigatensis]|uniref:alpha/beta hydrolase n=1 Tax=Smaragdicoccus niigatensis TaxID=359359 RepID=UPI000A4B7A62|nr:alpha/beta hydrolase [Smaragdicoccus niigatensis]